MKAKINYKSKKTIIIVSILLVLIIISGLAIGMFMKANDSSEAVGENNTISEDNNNNANQNEISQNQTGEANGGIADNIGKVENEKQPENQENKENTNNQGNDVGNNNTVENVQEQEFVVEKTEIIPERVISESYYVSWKPTQFKTNIKNDLNTSKIIAKKTVAKVTENGLIQNPESVKVGEILKYTISLTNENKRINGVATVKDIIPKGTEFVSATQEKLITTPTKYENSSEVTELIWKNVKIEANTTVNLEVYVKVIQRTEDEFVTSVQNKAMIIQGTTSEEIQSPETEVANIEKIKTSKVIYNEERPHEHIVVDGKEPLHEQDIIEYTITLLNSGSAEGTVKVSDTVPEGTTIVENSKVTVIDKNGVSTYDISELVEGINVTVGAAIEGEEGTSNKTGKATVTFKVIVNSFKEETKIIKNDMAKVDGEGINSTEDEAEKVYIDINATKKWENIENDAAKEYSVEDILLVLLANGKEIRSQQVNSNNNWTAVFDKLPKYENDKEIIYTVTEKALESQNQNILEKYYEAKTSVQGTNNITITNIFDIGSLTDTVDVYAKKVWENIGSDAAKAYEVKNIKLQILAKNKVVAEKVVTEKENWEYVFENLPKYDQGGNKIVYTVAESAVSKEDEDRLTKYTQNIDQVTGIITNIFDLSKVTDTTEIRAQKIWLNNGSDAAKAYKLSSVTFEARTYEEDGSYEVVQSKEVKADRNGEWKVTFEGLPKYDQNGNEIVYVIDEVATNIEDQSKLDVYNQEKGTSEDGTRVIINTFDSSKVKDTIEIKAQKVWKDNGSAAAEAYRMSTVTFEARVYARDKSYEVVQSKEVKADENGEWKVTFENLAKYDENGNEIIYKIDEVVTKAEDQAKLDVYNKQISTAEDGTKVITNTFDASKLKDTIEIKAQKIWKDNGSAAAEAYKMLSVTFEARRYKENGSYEVVQSKEVKADENGEWKVTFENLAKYDENGNEIVYVIEEVVTNKEEQYKLDAYNKEFSTANDGTKIITNTFEPSKVKDTTDIRAEKVWKDNGSDAAKAYKLSSIIFEVRIYAENGNYEVKQSKEVKADENGEWKVVFEDLQKYDKNGNEIVYVIDEVVANEQDQKVLDVYNKQLSIAEDGTKVITNTFDPLKVKDTTEIQITKIWEDNLNKYNTRPDSVTIKLSNGTNYVLTGVKNVDSWTKTINLPKYDEEGKIITYTATEENVPEGYTKVSEEGTTVTNRANVIIEKTAYKANEDGTIGNKVVASDEFKANDTVYYKLTFKNPGNNIIETKTLTDTLSLRLQLLEINGTAITEGTISGNDEDGYTWVSTVSKNTEGNTIINWTLTNVPAGEEKELIIKAKVSEEAKYKDLCQKQEGKTEYTAKLFVRKDANNYTNALGTVYLNTIDLSDVIVTLPSNDLYYILKNNNAIVDMVAQGISRSELKAALSDNGITLSKDEVVVWYIIKNENNEYNIYGEIRKTTELTVINNEVYMDNIKQDDVTIDLEDIEIGQSGSVTVKGVSTTTESISTPMDVVFILDTSGSMDDRLTGQTTRKAENMVNAVNTTISTIMSKNSNSRIGIVGYSGSASEIIPLGNYSEHIGNYLSIDSSWGSRYIQSNVSDKKYRRIDGGTNTQSGIKMGAEMLTKEGLDRTFKTTINGVEFTGTRTPVIILVTDGEPTYCYLNETATGTVTGEGYTSDTNEYYYYWTLRTASYYKGKVKNAYYGATGTQQAKMFTIGIGLDGELATTMLNPNKTNVDNLKVNTDKDGNQYDVADGEEEKELYDLLNKNNKPYEYSYADASTLGALTETDIKNFLNTSLESSHESFNVRNITIEESKERRIELTNIDTSKEFLLTIIPEEGTPIIIDSLDKAKTTNNGEYGPYVKEDTNTGVLYIDLTGIDRTTTVNITYWEK